MLPLLALLLVLVVPASGAAKTVNVEVSFTPYVGDPAKADTVKTVPGKAAIFLNGVPYAEQQVRPGGSPLQPDDSDFPIAVWLPVDALGPMVRKGTNTIRIEFTPEDPQTAYRARLAWANVADDGKPADGAGKEEKSGTGTLALERTVDAHFVQDRPWHHYPPVTALTDADKQQLAALALARLDTFQPDFAGLYRLLEGDRRLDVEKIKAAKCIDKAYEVGVRLDAPKADDLEYVITKKPEVVVRRKGRHLYAPSDPSAFAKIPPGELQMCAGIALSLAFPPKLVVVHEPDGAWKVVY